MRLARTHPQADSAGGTIQDSDDGEEAHAEKFALITASVVPSTILPCDGCDGGGGGPPPSGAPADTTRVAYLNPKFDDGWFGDLEIEIRADLYVNQQYTGIHGTAAFTASPRVGQSFSFPRVPMIYARMCHNLSVAGSSVEEILTGLYEMDGGLNGEDWNGDMWLTAADRMVMKTYKLDHNGGGDPHDDYTEIMGYVQFNWSRPPAPDCYYQ